MTTRGKAAAVSYSIVALISVVMGSIYLFSPQFMPYHAAALGTAWAALEPAEQILILALMRVAGGGWVAVGVALAVLVAVPFRQGQAWTVWLLPLLGLVFYLPNLYATVRVTLDTPATAPWYGNLAGIVALLAGYALCPTAGVLRREASG
jgi:ABC-type transport system involved in cytochrome c biogenesis permease component